MNVDTTYPHLGFNPVPGVPSDVAAMGDKIASSVLSLTEANGLVKRLRDANDGWIGAAGDAFRAHLNDTLVTDLSQAQTSLEQAVGVLSSWHTDLSQFKDIAARLDQEAAAAQQRLQQAQQEYEQATANPDVLSAHFGAGDKVTAAGGDLESIISRAKGLRDQHDGVARRAADKLKHATFWLAPHKPGVFERIGAALAAVGHWVKKHLNDIHSVLSTISAIGGLIALVTPPPIDAIALGVSVAAGAGSVGCDAANPEFRHGIRQLVTGHLTKESLGAAMTGVGDLLSVVPAGAVAVQAAKGADVTAEGATGIAQIREIASAVAKKPGWGAKQIVKIPGVQAAVNAIKLPEVARFAILDAHGTVAESVNLSQKAGGAAHDLYKDIKKAC